MPGHIHSAFWPRIFFVVFKAPGPGQTHVFCNPMTEAEAEAREVLSAMINESSDEIAKHSWVDARGQHFNDKYKVLQSAFLKRGDERGKEVLKEAMHATLLRKFRARTGLADSSA